MVDTHYNILLLLYITKKNVFNVIRLQFYKYEL